MGVLIALFLFIAIAPLFYLVPTYGLIGFVWVAIVVVITAIFGFAISLVE